MSTFDFRCEEAPVGDLLVRANHFYPSRDALVFPETRSTYAELVDGVIRVARGLLSLGIGVGDQVG
jgi:non-ribosomal peptide synthetase component E (peptide arylation enzyme)